VSVAGYGADRVPARADVVGVVRAAVARVLETEVASVDEATPLTREAGVDSLARAEIAELVEQGASLLAGRRVVVDDAWLPRVTDVGGLAAHVAARVEGGAG
jgi:hypothetical protein